MGDTATAAQGQCFEGHRCGASAAYRTEALGCTGVVEGMQGDLGPTVVGDSHKMKEA